MGLAQGTISGGVSVMRRVYMVAITLLTMPVLGHAAECGWLLMVPPAIRFTDPPKYDAPLGAWLQESATDTAKECEVLREQRLREAERRLEEATGSGQKQFAEYLLTRVSQLMNGRCLPASYVPLR